jgi:ABC-type multidrug transport system fused ATPase/permease subunit
MDSERILILSDGKKVEFDAPKKLLANGEGHFSKLMRHLESEANAGAGA